MDPADAEADAGRAQPVGQGHDLRLAAAGDHDPVHLDPLDEALEDAFLLHRLRQRCVQVRIEIVRGVDAEDPALAARVGRLQDGGQADGAQCAAPFGERAHRSEGRLRHPVVGEDPPHHDLVPHAAGDFGADRRQPEPLRHRSDDRDRAIGGDRQGAVDVVAAGDVCDSVDVGEVDRLGDVGDVQAGRVRVAVDADDTQAALAGLQDGAPLVPPRADEEDRLHCGRMLAAPRQGAVSLGLPGSATGRRRAASGRSRSRCRDGAGPTACDPGIGR